MEFRPGLLLHAIAHNKIMVIDRERIITGSFNFSSAAQEKNAENLVVITDTAQAQRYARNWQFHAGHSAPYGALNPNKPL